MLTPRHYQIDAVNRLRASVARGHKRVILQAATGAGKTHMACMVMDGAVSKSKRVLFLAHARELINQCSRKLDEYGIHHGILMAGYGHDLAAPVQVGSRDTILARAFRTERLELPPADLVIPDECHRFDGAGYQQIAAAYPNAVFLGLSATPKPSDFWHDLVEAAPLSLLIQQGFLVRAVCWAPNIPNLHGVKVQNGEYVGRQLAKRMDRPELVGDLVQHWKELAGGRSTIVFAVNIEHSLHIRDEYSKAGISCEHVDAKTPLDERAAILGRLQSGQTLVITNVGVLTEGFDCPRVSCIQDAAPTRSLTRAIQKWGRGLRSYEGKEHCVILDHAGNIVDRDGNVVHGFPDEDRDWSDVLNREVDKREKKDRDPTSPQPIVCGACHAVYSGRRDCPNCGAVPQRRGRDVEHRKGGKLKEVARQAKSPEDKQRFWNRCLAITAARGGKCRMAAGIYKREIGEWPAKDFRNVPYGAQWDQLVRELYPQFVRVRTA